MSGLLQMGYIFLFNKPFDPPLAGIIETIQLSLILI